MFKPAALFYSYIYNLDWHVVGCHPVAMQIKDNWFWIIYSVSALFFFIAFDGNPKEIKNRMICLYEIYYRSEYR